MKQLINTLLEKYDYLYLIFDELRDTLDGIDKKDYKDQKFDNLITEKAIHIFNDKISRKDFAFIINYIDNNVINELNLNSNIQSFDKLSDFFDLLGYEPDTDVLEYILEKSQMISSFLTAIKNKYDNLIQDGLIGDKISNQLLVSLIDAYYALNGLYKIENIDSVDKNIEIIERSSILSNDMVSDWINQTRNYPLLSTEEETYYLNEYASGNNNAKDKLVKHNLRLVISIASKYIGRGVAFEDLLQEGSIGLMRAIEKYDINKNTKLGTYATWWIRQAITRHIADTGRNVRLPVHINEDINTISKASRILLDKNGRQPSVEELASSVNMPPNKVKTLLKYGLAEISLNSKIDFEDSVELGDFIADENQEIEQEALSGIANKQFRNFILSCHLSKREFWILALRFGFFDDTKRTLEEIGEKLNITRERVRQIEEKALKKLYSNTSRAKELAAFTNDPDTSYKFLVNNNMIGYSQRSRAQHITMSYRTDIHIKKLKIIYNNLSVEEKALVDKYFDENFVSYNCLDDMNYQITMEIEKILEMILTKSKTYITTADCLPNIKKYIKKCNADILNDALKQINDEKTTELIKRCYNPALKPYVKIYISEDELKYLNVFSVPNLIRIINSNTQVVIKEKSKYNLAKKYNCSVNELRKYISSLPYRSVEIINTYFDINFNKVNDLSKSDSMYFYRNISPKLKERFLTPKSDNLADKLGLTKEELKTRVDNLKEKYKELFYKYYDIDFNKISPVVKEDRTVFYGNVLRTLKYEKVKKSLKPYNLCEKIDCSKERLNSILPRLTGRSKEILNTYFDVDFNTIKAMSKKDTGQFYNITLPKIKELLNERISITQKYGINDIKRFKGCLKYLNSDDQVFIDSILDKKLCLINELDYDEEQRLIRIINLCKNTFNMRIKKFTGINLIERTGKTKEELQNIIVTLDYDSIKIINDFFDDNYNIRNILIITPEISHNISDIITKLKRKNIEKKAKYLTEKLNVGKEQIDKSKAFLPEKLRTFLEEYYDASDNYRQTKNISYDLRNVYISLINYYKRHIINGEFKSYLSRADLFAKLDISKEEFSNIKHNLHPYYQKMIMECFDENYNQISSLPNGWRALINSINEYISKVNDPNNYLYLYLDIDKQKMSVLIDSLSEEQRNVLFKYFNSDFQKIRFWYENINDRNLVYKILNNFKYQAKAVNDSLKNKYSYLEKLIIHYYFNMKYDYQYIADLLKVDIKTVLLTIKRYLADEHYQKYKKITKDIKKLERKKGD